MHTQRAIPRTAAKPSAAFPGIPSELRGLHCMGPCPEMATQFGKATLEHWTPASEPLSRHLQQQVLFLKDQTSGWRCKSRRHTKSRHLSFPQLLKGCAQYSHGFAQPQLIFGDNGAEELVLQAGRQGCCVAACPPSACRKPEERGKESSRRVGKVLPDTGSAQNCVRWPGEPVLTGCSGRLNAF